MKKVITIVVLLAIAAIFAYNAIWARKIGDGQVAKLARSMERTAACFDSVANGWETLTSSVFVWLALWGWLSWWRQ